MEIICAKTKRDNSYAAGKHLGKQLAKISPEQTFLFSSVKYNFGELVRGILAETDTLISGCSAAGAICGNKIIDDGAVATGFSSPHIKFGSGIGVGLNKNAGLAGSTAIKSALTDLRRKKLTKIFAKYYAAVVHDPTQIIRQSPSFAALMFVDGLSGCEEATLSGITKELNIPLPLIGGSAGDDLQLKQTLQICNNKIYKNSTVLSILVTNYALGFAVGHGWRPRKKAVLVTKSKGRIVYELDNRPAADVYAELLNLKRSELLKEKQIAFKTGLQHPLAAISMSGDYWLKHPKEVFEDGAISFFSEVPQGVALVATDGSPSTLMKEGVNTVQQALNKIGNASAVFVVNCVARRAFLGKKAEEEIEQISELTDAPIFGFYSYGEQSFTPTTPLCHRNQTISVLAIGK